MIYCPACDAMVEMLTDGTCDDCGGAVIDLTAIVRDAEKQIIATVRVWVEKQKQRAVNRQTELRKQEEVWLKNRGAEQFATGLIAYLDLLVAEDEV